MFVIFRRFLHYFQLSTRRFHYGAGSEAKIVCNIQVMVQNHQIQ